MALQAIEHEVSAKKQCGTAAASARVRRGDAEGKIAARTGAIQQSGLLSDIRITAKEPLPLVITTAAQVLTPLSTPQPPMTSLLTSLKELLVRKMVVIKPALALTSSKALRV